MSIKQYAVVAIADKDINGLNVVNNVFVSVRSDPAQTASLIYSDEAGLNPISNPAEILTLGTLSFWIEEGDYEYSIAGGSWRKFTV